MATHPISTHQSALGDAPSPECAPANTKQRILDAAEDLFAGQGVAATSLRSIIAAAGVNSAAIHYHFGSKRVLIEALFARRIRPINQERLARLDALERSGTLDGASLLRAFLEPMFASDSPLGASNDAVRAALGRLFMEEPESFRALAEEQVREVRTRFAQSLVNTCPGLDVEEASERIDYAMGAVLHTLGRGSLAGDDSGAAEARDRRMDRLIRFLTPGLALPGHTTPSAPDERRTA